MPPTPGQSLDQLDTPQLLVDLDVVDANLQRLFTAARSRGIKVRVHFKSLKCSGLARYIHERGADGFLCAKLCEAEVLADAGLTDILVANQVVGPIKLKRLAELAKRATIRVCVDDAENITQIGEAARAAGATINVLIEVDIGMNRCGVPPGETALELVRQIQMEGGLHFAGLQGYDGHLQMLPDAEERRQRSLEGLEQLWATRRWIEHQGIPVEVVTGAGTGTWEYAVGHPAITEIQPGSFVLMDCAYHAVRPEFGCSLSILTTVISRRPGRFILDAGSKAISRDFGTPTIKGRTEEKVWKLSEEHTLVDVADGLPRIGARREVLPAHCCATMNLHRVCLGVRGGKVETVWPIEASGVYT